MKPLVIPQVNLNGTSREALVRQLVDVMRAFTDLQRALADAAPNGRDYQLRPEEFTAARDAWNDRALTIYAMAREIEQHAMAIQDGEKL